MAFIDWLIVAILFAGLLWLVLYVSRLNRSVADFLAANRTAGRYLLTTSASASSFGAISAVAVFEMHYEAGFPPLFWALMLLPINFIISATGWVTYRYRETRVFTLAQFFELRYSRNFRIFMGILCFLSGVLNYGIFPAVTAHFFLYFCVLPTSFSVFGLPCDTFTVLMAAQLGTAALMTQSGGQLTVLIADFVQGQFINLTMLLIIIWLLTVVRWDQVTEALSHTSANNSMVNPFQTGAVKDFNFWYFAIAAVSAFYSTMAWQGGQGFNVCARNPHEGQMGAILGHWRNSLTIFLPPVAAICAYVVMHHPHFRSIADQVNGQLAHIPNNQVKEQMTVPVTLRFILPVGLMGLFAAMMIAGTISTDTSYLHSWGSIFIQDVLMPVLGRPLSPEAHMRLLRISIFGVALFAFLFSLFFKQSEHILIFMIATGAIFLGGAGSVIIGGLYWNKGTTAAAWASMITGSLIAVGGIIAPQFNASFPFNGQQMYFFAIVASVSTYAVISLLQNKQFDLERVLHRGRYQKAVPQEERVHPAQSTGLAALGPGPDFTPNDRLVLWLTLGVQAFFFLSAIALTVFYFFFHFGNAIWLTVWLAFILICLVKGVVSVVWLLIGGIFDFKKTLVLLESTRRGSNKRHTDIESGESRRIAES